MSKHTKGPWKVFNGTDIFPDDDDREGARYIADCDVSADIGDDEKRANALLIAAAPDLLAEIDRLRRELEEARRALEQVCKDAKRVDVYQNGAPLDLVQPYLIDAARAALRAGEEGK